MNIDSTVFVVDDDAAVRDSLQVLVRSAGLRVEAYPSAEAFLEAYDPARPGCLVLDVRMTGMSGLELQEALRAREIDLPVIIVSGHASVPIAVRAMEVGAVDVIEKPYDPGYLKQRIREAIERDACARETRDRRRAAVERLASLTAREREVMNLLIQGNTVKAIASQAGLSHNTVQVHRARILEKTRTDSVVDLVRLAGEAGVGRPPREPTET